MRRIQHVAPDHHRRFYSALRYTLNVTRRDMVQAGYSPSVRLFEAAACGTPIISDAWPGIEHFFRPASEILLADGAEHSLKYLRDVPEPDRLEVARRARERVLREHSCEQRAAELERYAHEIQHTVAERPAHAVLTERTAS